MIYHMGQIAELLPHGDDSEKIASLKEFFHRAITLKMDPQIICTGFMSLLYADLIDSDEKRRDFVNVLAKNGAQLPVWG